jgi:peptidoglycan/LPS O-acetylase OafA/YrhL
LIKGGFIGVDVFFVISGYLISTIIFENLDKGTFSFTEFYARRVKRIFPALIIVLTFCFLLGWFVLLADEYKQLGKHIAAGAGFVPNLIFWNESGYFDNASQTKPLLHLWSLGIEEQFYLAWPLLLYLAYKEFNFITIIILVIAASFLLNLYGVTQDAVATFYSPYTRFWELMSGSLLAWMTLYQKQETFTSTKNLTNISLSTVDRKYVANGKSLSNILSFVGLLLLANGFWGINKEISFPGKWALLPVLGAVLIILAGANAWFNRIFLSNKVAVWFGLISYPLYLWHWPLLSFARIVEGEVPSPIIRIAAIVLSVMLAWVTYKFIELPIRLGKDSKTKIISLVALLSISGVCGFAIYRNDGLPFRNIVRQNEMLTQAIRWPYWDNPICDGKFGLTPCQYSSEPLKLMIIGDSHGNHIYPGLVSSLADGFGILWAGSCSPLSGINLLPIKHQEADACTKIDHVVKNLAILDANPSIKTVVLSSFWRIALDGQFIDAKGKEYWGGMYLKSVIPDETDLTSDELVYRGLKRTITELVRRDKNVIFVRDTPDFEQDIRDICVQRFSLNSPQDCQLPRSAFESRRVKESLLVEKLKQDFHELKVFDPFNTVCSTEKCNLIVDGKLLYRDVTHLSEQGSNLLGKALVNSYLSDYSK